MRLLPGARPRNVLFEVTPRCNLDCRHCYNVWKGGAVTAPPEADTAGALAILAAVVREMRPRSVTFTGGEPFLREDLPDLAAFLVDRGIEVSAITNGTLLDGEVLRRCLRAGLSRFQVTVLSADRRIHDGLTRRESLDATLRGISYIREAGGRLAAVFVATRENIGGFREVLELAAAMGADGVLFNRFNPGGEGRRNLDLLPAGAQIDEALRVAADGRRRWGIPVAAGVPIPPCLAGPAPLDAGMAMPACPLGTRDAYPAIDPAGDIRACNHSPAVLGNILREPFRAILRRQRAMLAARSLPAGCSACRHRPSCRGGCPAAAEACAGIGEGGDPSLAVLAAEGRA